MASFKLSTIRKSRLLALIAAGESLSVQAGCAYLPERETVAEPASSSEITAVQAYVAAFNARDVDGMEALMDRRIQWLSINGNEIGTVSSGRDSLTEDMRGYFATGTDVTSSLSSVSQNGSYVSTVETVSWTNENGEGQSQSSMAVYQLTEEGLIRRVWYFPEDSSGS